MIKYIERFVIVALCIGLIVTSCSSYLQKKDTRTIVRESYITGFDAGYNAGRGDALEDGEPYDPDADYY